MSVKERYSVRERERVCVRERERERGRKCVSDYVYEEKKRKTNFINTIKKF